jgi:tRNA(His) 5'-end guanylyltransferase
MDFLKIFKDSEKALRSYIPEDARYLAIRLDGKAFHTYTKDLVMPCDSDFMEAMDETTKILCQEVSGTVLGYTQSDEISLFLALKQKEGTMPWMGGSIQKIVSISAAIATAHFNQIRIRQGYTDKIGYFDSRVMAFSSSEDIDDYCAWRRADAIKNSTSMAAETYLPRAQIQRKHSGERREMLAEIGKPWEDLPAGFRYGRFTYREWYKETISFVNRKTKQEETVIATRNKWVTAPAIDGFSEEYINRNNKKEDNAA